MYRKSQRFQIFIFQDVPWIVQDLKDSKNDRPRITKIPRPFNIIQIYLKSIKEFSNIF